MKPSVKVRVVFFLFGGGDIRRMDHLVTTHTAMMQAFVPTSSAAPSEFSTESPDGLVNGASRAIARGASGEERLLALRAAAAEAAHAAAESVHAAAEAMHELDLKAQASEEAKKATAEARLKATRKSSTAEEAKKVAEEAAAALKRAEAEHAIEVYTADMMARAALRYEFVAAWLRERACIRTSPSRCSAAAGFMS
jgi:hypothetical protein